ncbi:hypothetical protein G5C60_05375 [Streptomyces sp. HC44]|uniref:Uncharacterized protein n=1 Tax=Streptomyces scabichelini TaxID=2711217 RepID=A0A6G4UZ86_9ACTN|nr:hypothetical protein [Streptomyces scabichelini]NGO07098.1 hypothetical protein [Streptomyces scabichelini]
MSSPYVAGAGEHEQLEWLGGGIMKVLLDARHTGGKPPQRTDRSYSAHRLPPTT